MIKDRIQKEMLYKHFRAQNWMAQIEVPIVTPKGINRKSPPVTDIDVLGIRPSPELRWRYIVGDCKTKKSESPVNRVLWATGLVSAVGGASSIVLLERPRGRRIEADHKLFADMHNVLLIEQQDFPAYDKAVVYPSGSAGYQETLDILDKLRIGIGERFPRLKQYLIYIMSAAWSMKDHSVLLRSTIAHARGVKGEINPERDEHLAVVLETASTFSVAFATLVGTVFRRYISSPARSDLADATRVIIWGGREQYEHFSRVRERLAQSIGKDTLEPLGLPEWDKFLELLRVNLDAPSYSFQLPQLFRQLSTGLIDGTVVQKLDAVHDRTLLHYGSRMATYVARASGFPLDVTARIKNLFNPRISTLATDAAAKARSKDA